MQWASNKGPTPCRKDYHSQDDPWNESKEFSPRCYKSRSCHHHAVWEDFFCKSMTRELTRKRYEESHGVSHSFKDRLWSSAGRVTIPRDSIVFSVWSSSVFSLAPTNRFVRFWGKKDRSIDNHGKPPKRKGKGSEATLNKRVQTCPHLLS